MHAASYAWEAIWFTKHDSFLSVASDFSRDLKSFSVHHIRAHSSAKLWREGASGVAATTTHPLLNRCDLSVAAVFCVYFLYMLGNNTLTFAEQGDTVFICGFPSVGVKYNKLQHPMLPNLTRLSVISQFSVIAKLKKKGLQLCHFLLLTGVQLRDRQL